MSALALGAALQFWFFERGFYSISWDEAGRTLDAYQWAQDGSVKSPAWLPFYRVVVGMGLRAFPDLVLTPRIITGVFGLACIPAVAWLTVELFQNRRIALISVTLAAVFSQRIALSLAPLSSILFAFFLVSAMACLARWQRTQRSSDLFWCGIVLAVACTVRFEGWLFVPSVLAAAWWRNPRTPRRDLVMLSAILLGFPVVEVVQDLLLQVSPVSVVMRDAQVFSLQQVFVKNPAVEFVRVNARCLNLLGAIPLALLVWRSDSRIRGFLGVAFAPLAVLSAGLLLARAAQTGPSWRDTVAWGMLLVPFTGWGIGALARHTRRPLAAGLAGLALFAAASLHDLMRIQAESFWAFPPADRAAGAYLSRLIETHPRTRIQIASKGFMHLNVLVASQHPESFVLNETPPAEDRPAYLLSQSPPPRSSATVLRQFGPWFLYCVNEEACRSAAN